MLLRYFLAGLLLLGGEALLRGQEDAQDRTQSFFDNHKAADVVNTERALAEKPKPTPETVRQSTLPPLTGLNEKEQKERRKLQTRKTAFLGDAKRKIMAKTAMAMTARNLDVQALEQWKKEKERDASRLEELDRKARVGKKSDSALPKLSY